MREMVGDNRCISTRSPVVVHRTYLKDIADVTFFKSIPGPIRGSPSASITVSLHIHRALEKMNMLNIFTFGYGPFPSHMIHGLMRLLVNYM